MRRLTLDEVDVVAAGARGDGSRPTFFNAQTSSEEEISQNFEAFLLLTPTQIRSNVSNFFQVVLDNDPNQVEVRSDLFDEFMEEEKRNELRAQRMFSQLTEYYDRVRTEFSQAQEGFSDVTEVVLLQESLNRSLGDIVSSRDRHSYGYSVLSVLSARAESAGPSSHIQELQSWIRTLVEYD